MQEQDGNWSEVRKSKFRTGEWILPTTFALEFLGEGGYAQEKKD
jgi:hypothetical protein